MKPFDYVVSSVVASASGIGLIMLQQVVTPTLVPNPKPYSLNPKPQSVGLPVISFICLHPPGHYY